jgi:hypothetical protein
LGYHGNIDASNCGINTSLTKLASIINDGEKGNKEERAVAAPILYE